VHEPGWQESSEKVPTALHVKVDGGLHVPAMFVHLPARLTVRFVMMISVQQQAPDSSGSKESSVVHLHCAPICAMAGTQTDNRAVDDRRATTEPKRMDIM
jgi:hypothetical protein